MALENPQSDIEKQYGDFRAPSRVEDELSEGVFWTPGEDHESFSGQDDAVENLSTPEAKDLLIGHLSEFRSAIDGYISVKKDSSPSARREVRGEASRFGSLINKKFSEAMRVADVKRDPQLQRVVFEALSRELLPTAELPGGGREYAYLRTGAVAEWVVARTLNDACYIDVFDSTIEEDINRELGNVDMWARPGSSEYSGFAETPMLSWAIQVKSAHGIEDLEILPSDEMDRVLSKIDSLDVSPSAKSEYTQSLDTLTRAYSQYSNVTPVLVLVPDFTFALGYIDNKTGMPKAPFEAAMDEALSEISDSKLAA